MKVPKKFYVAAKHLVNDNSWCHLTEEGAVKHAKKILEEEGGESLFIVKIIKVVKKKETPYVVEVVK